ncbi:butyrophilin subfamily 1 member A1-like [Eucyclogobius newberryi]|uniref:butyrophilin subfamily 1 member A1-like n=1 Tax=Eucyclogobius newberryi TaxID=166745 RepID=UPI003B59C16E
MKLWMFLLLLWSSAGGQDQTTAPVTCVVMETCVLPCSFTPGDGVVIQWHKERESPSEQDYLVHVYAPGYSTSEQDAPFRGRTSLFPEEFSRGNASVSLTEVRVKDQGKYLCRPYTTEHDWAEEWIKLRVKAPGTALNMEQKGDRLVCSSEDIYPQPNVSWTPDVRPQTLVKETQNQLHSISSSLTFDPLQQYTCNISTHHSWKSATYSVHTPMEMSRNVTIPCTTSVSPVKRLVWTFNYIEPIVTVSGADVDYAAPWRKFVKGVSEWGSLSLQELGSEQEGVYLCELHTDSHTHFSRTELRVHQDAGPNIGVIVGSVVGVALCVTFIIIFIMWKHKKETKSDPPEAEALLPLLPLDPREYSCEFSLDPNTAHRKLKLSEDNRTVTCEEEEQEYEDHEDRFTFWPQVLSSTGLRGRCYWEVEWKGEVFIAVSYKGIRRRGIECRFGFNDKSWSLYMFGCSFCALHNNNRTVLYDFSPSQNTNSRSNTMTGISDVSSIRVGVFLDSEAGTLTFYKICSDGENFPLHTFYSSFTEPLFPGFGLLPDSSVTVMDLKLSQAE